MGSWKHPQSGCSGVWASGGCREVPFPAPALSGSQLVPRLVDGPGRRYCFSALLAVAAGWEAFFGTGIGHGMGCTGWAWVFAGFEVGKFSLGRRTLGICGFRGLGIRAGL